MSEKIDDSSEWTDGEVLTAADLNDSFDRVVDMIRQQAQEAIENRKEIVTLSIQAGASVDFDSDNILADIATDATGEDNKLNMTSMDIYGSGTSAEAFPKVSDSLSYNSVSTGVSISESWTYHPLRDAYYSASATNSSVTVTEYDNAGSQTDSYSFSVSLNNAGGTEIVPLSSSTIVVQVQDNFSDGDDLGAPLYLVDVTSNTQVDKLDPNYNSGFQEKAGYLSTTPTSNYVYVERNDTTNNTRLSILEINSAEDTINYTEDQYTYFGTPWNGNIALYQSQTRLINVTKTFDDSNNPALTAHIMNLKSKNFDYREDNLSNAGGGESFGFLEGQFAGIIEDDTGTQQDFKVDIQGNITDTSLTDPGALSDNGSLRSAIREDINGSKYIKSDTMNYSGFVGSQINQNNSVTQMKPSNPRNIFYNASDDKVYYFQDESNDTLAYETLDTSPSPKLSVRSNAEVETDYVDIDGTTEIDTIQTEITYNGTAPSDYDLLDGSDTLIGTFSNGAEVDISSSTATKVKARIDTDQLDGNESFKEIGLGVN